MGARRAYSDCILDVYLNADTVFTGNPFLFPNWIQAPAASFWILECDDVTCSLCKTSEFTGLTILNYGSATGGAAGDLTGMYFQFVCGSKTNVGPVTMTYAGSWSARAAWTWAGSIAWGGGGNPCDGPSWNCSCWAGLYV